MQRTLLFPKSQGSQKKTFSTNTLCQSTFKPKTAPSQDLFYPNDYTPWQKLMPHHPKHTHTPNFLIILALLQDEACASEMTSCIYFVCLPISAGIWPAYQSQRSKKGRQDRESQRVSWFTHRQVTNKHVKSYKCSICSWASPTNRLLAFNKIHMDLSVMIS